MSSNKINPAYRYAPADFFVKQTFQTQIIKIIIHHACLLVGVRCNIFLKIKYCFHNAYFLKNTDVRITS